MRGFVVGWSCAGAASCTSQPLDDETGLQAPATPAEFAREFAEGICNGFSKCCGEEGFAFDLGGCQATFNAETNGELADFDGLQVDWDPQAALRCIQDYSQAICGETDVSETDVKHNCNLMFRGRLTAGQGCVDQAECRTGPGETAYCDVGATGVCVVSPPPGRGKPSEACNGTCTVDQGSNCGGGNYSQNNAPGADALPLCQTSDGLQCSPDPDLGWSCQPLLAIGESCADNGYGCSRGAFCNVKTSVCEAQLPLGQGSCADLEDACLPPAICDYEADECVALKSNGEACSSSSYCQSGFCNLAGVCSRPELPKALCADPSMLGVHD